MISYLTQGLALGVYAGLSPGPLNTLLIAESLRGGWPAGFRIACAPLISDGLLIVLALLLTAPLPGWGMAVLNAAGGAMMIWMGWGTFRSQPEEAATGESTAGETGSLLIKGVATNVLNPNAILFWLVTGAPLLQEAAASTGWAGPIWFMTAFFALLVGSKLLLAYGVSRGRRFLQGAGYRWSLGASGLALMLLGGTRIWAGAVALL